MFATELGWTFQSIDELTMLDVNDIMDYWDDNPPVPMLVRAYMGVGGKKKPKKATKQDLAALVQQFGG